MDFMHFGEGTPLQRDADRFNTKDVFPAKMYTWATLEQSGYAPRFEAIICPTYSDGFTDTGLRTLFFMDEPVYKPLLVEFLTSFTLDKVDRGNDFNKEKIIHFRLCGQLFNISLCTFAHCLGLVSGNDRHARRAYVRHLNEATTDLPQDFNFGDFWEQISNMEYQGSNCREAHLKDPVVRLVHRYLAWTICFNSDSAKCNKNQIYGLYHCLNRNHRWHLPLAVAEFFVAAKKQPQRMPGGQFVTRIADTLELLTGGVLSNLGQARIFSNLLPLSYMALSYLLKKVDEDTFVPYEIGEREVEEAEPRGRAKRSRRAMGQHAGSSSQAPQAGSSSQPHPEYTNEYIVQQNNLLGVFVGQLSNQVYQAELRSEMRFQLMPNVPYGPYPEVYHQGWEPLPDWETRMASLNINEEEEEE